MSQSVVLLTVLLVKIASCKFLIFPTTSPQHKLVAGFGVPIQNLAYENLLVGYVFKARFRLPASAKQLRTHDTQKITGRGREDGFTDTNSTHVNAVLSQDYSDESYTGENKASGYRWAIYKGLETIGNRMGLVGRSCVLKSICEMAETPLHYHNGIYAEIFHILFTPSASADKISIYSDNEYYHAEELGLSGAPCDRAFKDCTKSFVEQFTDMYKVTHDIFEKLG